MAIKSRKIKQEDMRHAFGKQENLKKTAW